MINTSIFVMGDQMSKLDIGSLEALCAIAEHGGVTRAAAKLSLSQSAVSHKVKRLEENLGCKLLDRTANTSIFTREGEQLLAYGRRILTLHDEALLSLTKQPLHGKIRLGITEEVANAGLARILGQFIRLYPEVRVHTITGQSLPIEAQLEGGELDIGVFQLFEHRVQNSDTLLSKEALYWIKTPDLKLDYERPIPFLAFDNDCFYREWAMDADHPRSPNLETILTCSSTSGILAGVSSGLGVTLISERHMQPEFEVIGEPFPSPPIVATIVRSCAQCRSNAATALGASILDELGRRRAIPDAVLQHR
ncbi:LysR family transcriptional regulator [Pectobacterium versatile]|uniref:LysR family transcriptional regulator n=1 Tax=Pectobacterium versatile TaxID=2488639 RepID=UPI00197E2754|nr:LysR family transcriptional regulator [Pectobacterium versatile]